MLSHLSTYSDYLRFVSSFSADHPHFQDSLLDKFYFDAFFKMVHLRVDDIIPLLSPLYSHTGRPARYQMEILRSFILMAHFHELSIKKWVKTLRRDHTLAVIAGFSPDSVPAPSNHYDFLSRIFHHFFYYDIFPPSRNSKPHAKLKKGEKLNTSPQGTTDLAVDFYLDGNDDNDRPELLLQTLFDILAVQFSVNMGLIDNPSSLIASGDGSALHIHSNSFGNKICDCHSRQCDCPRRYSDPEADIGWDSDLGMFYFGYTEYNISYYNNRLGVALPLFLSLEKASQHDSLTAVSHDDDWN